MTKRLMVGAVPVGGGAPVSIQSMCSTKTDDVEATTAQILALEAAGCEIIRVAVPDQAAAEAVDKLKERIHIPLVADIHFNYKYAIACAERGVDAIRINPGNIGGEERVKAVADLCRQKGIPIRVGVNGGSLEKELRAKYGGVTAEALVESAMGHVRLLNKFDFEDICISVKCSDVYGHRRHHSGDAHRRPGGGDLRRQKDFEGGGTSKAGGEPHRLSHLRPHPHRSHSHGGGGGAASGGV